MIIEVSNLYMDNEQFSLSLQLLQKYIRMDQIRNMQQYTETYEQMVQCVKKMSARENIKEQVENMGKEIGNLIE